MAICPFAVTSAILNEQTSVSDELRIVACDGGVKRDVRHVLIQAADELELQNRTIAFVYTELLETRMRLTAAQDQIKSLRREPVKPAFLMHMGMQIGPTPMVQQGWVTK